MLDETDSVMRLSTAVRLHPILEIAAFFVVCGLVHLLTITLIFPGYYQFVPHHTDMFFPAQWAGRELSLAEMAGLPRPVGTIIARYMGAAGVAGSLALITATVLLNISLFSALLRRTFKMPLDANYILAVAACSFLIVAHPYFYYMASWDALASFSFTFLVAAFFAYRHAEETHPKLALFLAFGLSLLAFLCKETYVFAILPMCALLTQSFRKAAGLASAFLGAFILAYVYNRAVASEFLTGAEPTSPYYVSLNPLSISAILWGYAVDGFGLAFVAVFVLAAGLITWRALITGKRNLAIAPILLITAGVLALVPNAILPNHRFTGYSWVSSYFIFATVLLICAVNWGGRQISRFAKPTAAVVAVVLGLALFDYSGSWWTKEQEMIIGKQLSAIYALADEPHLQGGPKRVLVYISFPFTPFDRPEAFRSKLPNKEIEFVVSRSSDRSASEEGRMANYDAVWIFRENGNLAFTGNPHSAPDLEIIRHLLSR